MVREGRYQAELGCLLAPRCSGASGASTTTCSAAFAAAGCAGQLDRAGPAGLDQGGTFCISQSADRRRCRTASSRASSFTTAVGHRLGSAALGHRRGAGDRLGRHACVRPLAASRPRPRCDQCRLHTLHGDHDTGTFNCNKKFGKSLTTSWSGLDIFQIGGVIFF